MANFILYLKDAEAGVQFTAHLLPSVTAAADVMVAALGIVVNARLPLALALPEVYLWFALSVTLKL
jgi:hypothetical protein